MKKRLLLAMAVALLPVWAHHPFSETFDSTKPVTITGQVKEFQWADPHTSIRLDGEAPNTGEWKMDGASSATLRSQAWSETSVKAGDRVTIYGYRSKDGSQSGSGRSIMLANGRHISMSDPTEDGGPAPQVSSGQNSKAPGDVTAQTQAQPGELPRTASDAWVVGLVGAMLMGAAFLLTWRRRVF